MKERTHRAEAVEDLKPSRRLESLQKPFQTLKYNLKFFSSNIKSKICPITIIYGKDNPLKLISIVDRIVYKFKYIIATIALFSYINRVHDFFFFKHDIIKYKTSLYRSALKISPTKQYKYTFHTRKLKAGFNKKIHRIRS